LRILLFSDIHSNLEALQATLADASSRGFDRSICLGDIVGYGADPEACVSLVSGLPHGAAVMGNHDAAVIDPRRDVDAYLAEAQARDLRIIHVIETHLHNDYVSGGRELASLTGASLSPAAVPTQAWLPLLGLGLVATAIAIQTFYAGVKRVGAARASLISTVEPVYTILLAMILFDERLTPVQLVGGLLVLLAVILAETGRVGEGTQPGPRAADTVAPGAGAEER